MSQEPPADPNRPPVDELPRSEVSDPNRRPPEHAPDSGQPGHGLMWLLLGLLAVAAFVAALWVLNPPSERLGKDVPDIVVPPPAAPKR